MTKEDMQSVITEALKPVVTRLDTLEAKAKGAPAPAAAVELDKDPVIVALESRLKNIEGANSEAVKASAKATVQAIGVKAGRIGAQDTESIAYWEGAIAANAKAADVLAKMPVNPAFVQIVQSGGAGTTGTTGEHEFITKAKAHGDTHKIADAIEAQTAFARTTEGRALYNDYCSTVSPRKK